MTSPDKQRKGDDKFSKQFGDSGQFIASGIQMAAAIVIMYVIGVWIDTKWQYAPWGMIGCVVFGAVAGLVHFIREVIVFSNKESQHKSK